MGSIQFPHTIRCTITSYFAISTQFQSIHSLTMLCTAGTTGQENTIDQENTETLHIAIPSYLDVVVACQTLSRLALEQWPRADVGVSEASHVGCRGGEFLIQCIQPLLSNQKELTLSCVLGRPWPQGHGEVDAVFRGTPGHGICARCEVCVEYAC